MGDSKVGDSAPAPDLFVYGLRSFETVSLLDPTSQMWVDGREETVLQSRNVRMVLQCKMCLKNFPLDSHVCMVKFGSYSKDSSRLVFAPGADLASGNNFFEDAAETTSPFSFEFMGDLPDDQTYYESAYGNFSITGFQIRVTRNVSPYIVTTFLPSAVIVVLSWASFIIPNQRIPSRFTYLAVLMLALVCVIGASEVSAPRANVFTALQLWFLVCMLFLLAPAVEFGVLLLRQRRRWRRRHVTAVRQRGKYEAAAGGAAAALGGDANGAAGEDPMEEFDDEFWRYDRIYLCLFPVLFFLFNIVYWLTYAV